MVEKHLKYKGFSYNPDIIVDFLILTNEAFSLSKEVHDCSNFLQEVLSGNKEPYYGWLYYDMENPEEYRFDDFCLDKQHGMREYYRNFDGDYEDFMIMIQIWMACDYIWTYESYELDKIEISAPQTIIFDSYVRQFIEIFYDHNNEDIYWSDNPIEKRWWLDDNEYFHYDLKKIIEKRTTEKPWHTFKYLKEMYKEKKLINERLIKFSRKKVKLNEDWDDDKHLSCYSYPNCDISPLGCDYRIDNPEEYGHKD
jgi:hypothetical protein